MDSPIPTIHNFAFTQPVIKKGTANSVSWTAEHYTRLLLRVNGEEYDCTNKNSWQFENGNVEECELIAYSDDDVPVASEKAFCTIVAPIRIRHFEAEHKSVLEGQPVLLSWEVIGAEAIILMPGGTRLTPSGKQYFHPRESVEYILEASNSFYSSRTKSCFVHVQAIPQIPPLILPSMPALNGGIAEEVLRFLDNNAVSGLSDEPLGATLLMLYENPFAQDVAE